MTKTEFRGATVTDEPNLGIRCPRCRSKMHVTHTESLPFGKILRRRHCRACGHRSKTIDDSKDERIGNGGPREQSIK